MTDLHLTPQPPVDLHGALPAGQRAMIRMEAAIAESPLPKPLYELIKVRASQINGCAFCLDLHHREASAAGETTERLVLVRAWRETELFTHEERVALALTEALTLVASGHVSAELEAEARRTFDDATYAAIVYGIVAINAWNRLSIAGHAVPGTPPRPAGA